MSNFLQKRNGVFYFFRRVPAHLRRYDSRGFVRISLKTRDETEAARRAVLQNDALENYWREMVKRPPGGADMAAYKDAVAMARSHGFAYLSIADIAAAAPVADIVERLRAIHHAEDKMATAAALLGGVAPPKTLLSSSAEVYFALTPDRIAGRAGDFVRKWKHPRQRALAHLIEAVGDKPLAEISRRDLLEFRKWWAARIAAGQSLPDTANKDFMHIKNILRVVGAECGVNFDVHDLFRDTRFKEVKNSRTPFEAKHVQDIIFAPHA